MNDRYASATRGEDLGLGLDEPTTHRFTRPTDRVDLTSKTATAAPKILADRVPLPQPNHLQEEQ